MMLILRLAFRNALRNAQRTLLTAGTIVFGTALLTVSMAWMNGIFEDMLEASTASIGHVRVVKPEFAARETLMPIYENIAPVDPVLAAVRVTPGVVAAYPRIEVGVTVTVGEELGDVFGMAVGAPEAWFRERLHANDVVVDGTWFTGAEGELVMGRTLATQAGAKVGDVVVLLGQTQDGSMSPISGRLVGVTAAGNPLMDQQIFVPLDRLQWLTDIPDGAVEILAYGAHRDGAGAVAAALSDNPALDGLEVQAWSAREPWAGMVTMTSTISGVLAFVIVFITALGVWNTMMMSVLERTGEIGVLRAMGLGRVSTVSLFVVEAMAIATIGGVVGVGIGGGFGLWLETNGVSFGERVTQNMSADFPMSTTFYADMSPEVALQGFMLGLVMAILGSALPAMRAASIQPVSAMRARR